MPNGNQRWIDLQALTRNTFDDTALREEVLRLFVTQSQELVERLHLAETAGEWAALAHRLKGSALGIGASEVALLAADAEKSLFESQMAARKSAAAPLSAAVSATNAEIIALLG